MGNGLRKERSKKRDGKEEGRPSHLKIAFQGPGGVGKSSLLIRYVQVLFSFSFLFSFFFLKIFFLFLRTFFWRRNMIQQLMTSLNFLLLLFDLLFFFILKFINHSYRKQIILSADEQPLLFDIIGFHSLFILIIHFKILVF